MPINIRKGGYYYYSRNYITRRSPITREDTTRKYQGQNYAYRSCIAPNLSLGDYSTTILTRPKSQQFPRLNNGYYRIVRYNSLLLQANGYQGAITGRSNYGRIYYQSGSTRANCYSRAYYYGSIVRRYLSLTYYLSYLQAELRESSSLVSDPRLRLVRSKARKSVIVSQYDKRIYSASTADSYRSSSYSGYCSYYKKGSFTITRAITTTASTYYIVQQLPTTSPYILRKYG